MSAPSARVENSDYNIVGKPFPSAFLVFMNVTNTVTHFVLGAVAFIAIFFANGMSTTTSFKQHIYLCVTGYIIMMSQAVLSMNPHTGWAQSLKYNEKKRIHWVMQIIGSILAVTGSIIRMTNLNSHFQSPHGIFGIVAMILTILSLVGGVANLYSMRLKMNPTIIKISHSCLGSLTLIFAFLALIFGFDKSIYRRNLGDINASTAIGITAVALVGTLLSACMSVFRRIFNR